jgi:GR25 family glycosyltransferase involved in LPS biosynthesis
MTDSPSYTGLYINLDRSMDRRRTMEDQLRRFNLAGRYARFAAIDARDIAASGQIQPGEAACFQSHYQALLKGRSSGSAVHILEDDVLLSQYLEEAARTIVASNLFDRFDIVFTDTFVHTDVMQLGFYKQAFDHALAGGRNEMKFTVIDLAQRHLACMSSYFVAAKSVDKVLAIYREELERGPRMPVDFCVRLAAQENRLRVGCWFPFVTSIMLEYVTSSTISGRENQHNNPSVMLPALLRHSFFIDHDLEGYAKRFLDGMMGDASGRTVDPHRDFLLRLMEFIVSGRYRTF